MNKIYRSTLKPDTVDLRDYVYQPDKILQLPPTYDLRQYANTIEDQGILGSCVANASVSALEILLQRNNQFFDLSRLFQYYNIREPYPDLKDIDEGAYLRDAFKIPSKLGICPESIWPYDQSKVNIKPDVYSYTEALKHMVTQYERIMITTYTLENIKQVIYKGFPVIFGADIAETLYYLSGPLNTHKYKGVTANDNIGGHAMNIVGYDDTLNGFIVENSWGTNWGDKGYFLLDYQVFMKDTHDIWTCTGFNNINFDNNTDPIIPVPPEPIVPVPPVPITPEPEPKNIKDIIAIAISVIIIIILIVGLITL